MTEQCGCGCEGHEHKEGTCSCGCGEKTHHHHEHSHHDLEGHCNCAEKFLRLADEAWQEVLKEKIKDKIRSKRGEHIEKLAEIVATANGEKWKHIISAKIKCNQFKDNLKDFLHSWE